MSRGQCVKGTVLLTHDTWGKKVTTTGTLAGTLGLFQPFRYRGYVYDWETGFYYLQSRYYDPTTGRFISADVLLSTGQGVLGHNCYAYCLDNPVMMVDDQGDAPWWLLLLNWGYVHKEVQKRIHELYGIEIEHKCGDTRKKCDLFNSNNSAIWEVKSCGPASLTAVFQAMDYVATEGGTAHLGTGIGTEVFPFTGPNGEDLWCMYWEPQAGVILYAWGESIEEMQKDALNAALGATALKGLKSAASYFKGRIWIGGAGGGGRREEYVFAFQALH